MTIKDQLKNLFELKLIEKILIPLINALDTVKVEKFHGVREKGIDIYFAYYDIFGEIKHCGVFVKKGNICKSGKNDIRKMQSQIQEALVSKFIDPINNVGEVMIEEFYFACNGFFTRDAREYLTEFCRSRNMPYVKIIDIDKLEQHIIKLIRTFPAQYIFKIGSFNNFCGKYKMNSLCKNETLKTTISEGKIIIK